jgi:anti-sigma regulatory factor (Ser/Thr protein kinase)
MGPSDKRTLRITVRRSHARLDSAKKKIASYLTKQGVHTDVVSAVDLAFYELAINIVGHEPEEYGDEPIALSCVLDEGEIRLELSYRGSGFDMTSVELPDIGLHIRQGKKRGLGIYFMRKLMDEILFQHSDGVTRLTLIKKIPIKNT